MLDRLMRRGSTERLFALSASALFFHVMTSLVQEAVFYLPGFHHTLLLTFAQALCVALFACVQLYRSSPVPSASPWRRLIDARRAPLTTYFFISIMNTSSVFLTNEGSRLLSYTTQVVFKSSKLLVVWIVRYLAIELPARAAYARGAVALMKDDLEEEEHFPFHSHQGKVHEYVESGEKPTGVVLLVKGETKTVPNTLPLGTNTRATASSIGVTDGQKCSFAPPGKAHGVYRMPHYTAERTKLIREICSCVIVVLGLIVFTYATSKSGATHHSKGTGKELEWTSFLWGIGCVAVALLCDAFMYLGEEKYCFHAHNSSNDEVQFYLFLFSALNGLVLLVMSGEVQSSLEFVQGQKSFLSLLFASSLTNYCGGFLLLRIISEFNSNTATVVTSVRKMITIICSCIVYPKPFGIPHFFGIVLVMSGIWQYEVARKMHTTSNLTHGTEKEKEEEENESV